MESRAAELVGLTPEYVEPLQMVGYRRHDKFDLHHDMGTYNSETGAVEAVSPRRLVTFFVVRACLRVLLDDYRCDLMY